MLFFSPMLSPVKHKRNLSALSISSSSSSSSASTSSSSYHSPTSSIDQNRSQVTMEEVWKEINLGSLHHHRQLNIDHESILRNQNPNNSIFQDFLNKPLNQQTPPPSSSPSMVTALYGSPLPLPKPPATLLSLNSGISFRFLDNEDSLLAPNLYLQNNTHSFGKKRGQDCDESRGDRRHKRMIKNRESAARSRARKQERVSPHSSSAYRNELELEIVHLQTENARLKRQQEKMQLKMAEATQHQIKKTLQRSSSM